MEELDAGKAKIDSEQAWSLCQKSDYIYVAKGKQYAVFTADEARQDEILGNAIGRSGSLRAPTLRAGKTFVVGFNDELYREILRERE